MPTHRTSAVARNEKIGTCLAEFGCLGTQTRKLLLLCAQFHDARTVLSKQLGVGVNGVLKITVQLGDLRLSGACGASKTCYNNRHSTCCTC